MCLATGIHISLCSGGTQHQAVHPHSPGKQTAPKSEAIGANVNNVPGP
jgi:hypothetical protein